MSAGPFFAVLDQVRKIGTSDLSATAVADLFGLQHRDLAEIAGVHRNTIRTRDNSPKLQAVLRDLMRVLSVASSIQPDMPHAFFLIKNAPIPTFRHKTVLQLVGEGRTDDAVDYLESVRSGFAG
jgi:hypothetical protein